MSLLAIYLGPTLAFYQYLETNPWALEARIYDL